MEEEKNKVMERDDQLINSIWHSIGEGLDLHAAVYKIQVKGSSYDKVGRSCPNRTAYKEQREPYLRHSLGQRTKKFSVLERKIARKIFK